MLVPSTSIDDNLRGDRPLSQEQARDLFHRIERAADHIPGLVEDLLDVSVIESGNLALGCEPVDTESLIAMAVEQVRPLAIEKSVAIEVTSLPPGATIVLDRDRILKVVTILPSNVSKYSDSGVVVTMSVHDHVDAEEFSVRDQGLAICRRIVDAHGGRIELESAEGVWPVFPVHLPTEPGG